jgi:hypothetical protein
MRCMVHTVTTSSQTTAVRLRSCCEVHAVSRVTSAVVCERSIADQATAVRLRCSGTKGVMLSPGFEPRTTSLTLGKS